MATRVPLSTDDIVAASSSSDVDEDNYSAKIPILKRRAAAAAKTASCSCSDGNPKKDPICVIVVGMAGSGKTTLMAQLQRSLNLREDGGSEDENVSFNYQFMIDDVSTWMDSCDLRCCDLPSSYNSIWRRPQLTHFSISLQIMSHLQINLHLAKKYHNLTSLCPGAKNNHYKKNNLSLSF